MSTGWVATVFTELTIAAVRSQFDTDVLKTSGSPVESSTAPVSLPIAERKVLGSSAAAVLVVGAAVRPHADHADAQLVQGGDGFLDGRPAERLDGGLGPVARAVNDRAVEAENRPAVDSNAVLGTDTPAKPVTEAGIGEVENDGDRVAVSVARRTMCSASGRQPIPPSEPEASPTFEENGGTSPLLPGVTAVVARAPAGPLSSLDPLPLPSSPAPVAS